MGTDPAMTELEAGADGGLSPISLPGEVLDLLVVGGGVTGLTLARDVLARRPRWNVLVAEGGERPGGTMRSDRVDGALCEWGPAGFLTNVAHTRDLAVELGLESRLLPALPTAENRFLWVRGALRPVPMKPLAFLGSSLLSRRGRGRVLLEPFVPRRRGDGDESIHAFASRRIGREAASVLVDAMVSGVYAGDPSRLSLAATFPRMAGMEREHGSLVRAMFALRRERRRAGGGPAGPGGTLTTFDEGMETLIRALTASLGTRVRCRLRAASLTRAGEDYRIVLDGPDGSRTVAARRVVLALPAFVSQSILASSFPAIASLLGEIPYAGITVACLFYDRDRVRHPLDGFGFLVPRGQGIRMLGAIWTGSIFPPHVPDGRVVLRVMLGGARDPEASMLSEGKTVDIAHGELDRILGGIEGRPAGAAIFRHPKGIPQYEQGHPRRLEALDRETARYPGLYLAGNAYRGIGVNDCVREAGLLAGRIAGDEEDSRIRPDATAARGES
jgi:oxygen-dependent protoporphyrinogen oxidase